MDDKATRDTYHQVIQERNALVHKTKGVSRNQDDSSENNSDDEESDSDDDATKKRATDKMLKAVDSD